MLQLYILESFLFVVPISICVLAMPLWYGFPGAFGGVLNLMEYLLFAKWFG
jgi:hypothetical protein